MPGTENISGRIDLEKIFSISLFSDHKLRLALDLVDEFIQRQFSLLIAQSGLTAFRLGKMPRHGAAVSVDPV